MGWYKRVLAITDQTNQGEINSIVHRLFFILMLSLFKDFYNKFANNLKYKVTYSQLIIFITLQGNINQGIDSSMTDYLILAI